MSTHPSPHSPICSLSSCCSFPTWGHSKKSKRIKKFGFHITWRQDLPFSFRPGVKYLRNKSPDEWTSQYDWNCKQDEETVSPDAHGFAAVRCTYPVLPFSIILTLVHPDAGFPTTMWFKSLGMYVDGESVYETQVTAMVTRLTRHSCTILMIQMRLRYLDHYIWHFTNAYCMVQSEMNK